MERWVQIEFDCLPLRSVGRLGYSDRRFADLPRFLRAGQSGVRKARIAQRVLPAQRALCFPPDQRPGPIGMLEFRFEGVVLTDDQDLHAMHADLEVELLGETCNWLTEPVVRWFQETVSRAVLVEFDRYIQAGDLERTRQRGHRKTASRQRRVRRLPGHVPVVRFPW
jgi:hypothetical protein